MGDSHDENEDAVVQEREVDAAPDVEMVEERDEDVDALEEETEEESEERESERIEERVDEKLGGRTRKSSGGRSYKKRAPPLKKLRHQSK